MIDPVSTIQIITSLYASYEDGKEIAKWLDGLYYGDESTLNAGISYYDAAEKSSSADDKVKYVMTAINLFENSIGQKKHIDATAFFYLALCYLMVGDFKKSYSFLDNLSSISTGTGTVKRDTIEDIKRHGKDLRDIIRRTEEELARRQSGNKSISKSKKGFVRMLVISLLTAFLLITVILILAYKSEKDNNTGYVSFETNVGMRCSGTEIYCPDTICNEYSSIYRDIEGLNGCNTIAFRENNKYAVINRNKALWSNHIDEGLGYILREYVPRYLTADINMIGNDFVYIVQFNKYDFYYTSYYASTGVPNGMKNKLKELLENTNNGKSSNSFEKDGLGGFEGPDYVYSACFNKKGEWCIITNTKCCFSNEKLRDFVHRSQQLYGEVNFMYITERGRIAICDNGIYFEGIPHTLANSLGYIDFKPKQIKFLDNGAYVIIDDNGKYSSNLFDTYDFEQKVRKVFVDFCEIFV